MSQPVTLESIYHLLTGFIAKQETFNSKQEAFNSKQEAFNIRIENKIDSFQDEEKANHNLSHRMIMQAFEGISDIRKELDTKNTEPWLRK